MDDSRKHIPSLLTALVVAILPHLGRLPLWIVLWCAVMWVYVAVSLRYKWPWPRRSVRILLTIAGLIGLMLTYDAMRLGPEAYLGLLAIMAALKPFEVQTHRDRMITVFLAYFIVITSLLQAETLAITIYMFFSVWVTTAALIRINDPGGELNRNLKFSGVILAQAIPLMLVLFFLFPRLDGSLFGFSQSRTGRTGFSDTLSPGGISQLAKDDSVAFRVEFEKTRPKAENLYWRGVVFKDFDGRTWHKNDRVKTLDATLSGEDSHEYTVALEPGNHRRMFALDMPVKAPRWATMRNDYTLVFRRPVDRTRHYHMQSHTSYSMTELSQDKSQWTRLPQTGNEKTRDLVKELTRNTVNTSAAVDKILDYLAGNGFAYSLQPQVLGRNPVDDFVFRTREGYCEHFASAFAFMARSADIPARIVGGYLGGEINPFGDYLIVRQSHAHVWVEVWDGKNGWIRVDPTAVVAPERMTGGPEGIISDGSSQSAAGRYLQPIFSITTRIRYGWDAISTKWESWFSNYSSSEQRALLERLGIEPGSWKGWIKAVSMILVFGFLPMGAYLYFQLKSASPKQDPVKRTYEIFLKKLGKAGMLKNHAEGPGAFADKACRNRPDLEGSIRRITELYVQLRYASDSDSQLLKSMKSKVRDFRPRR